MQLQLEERGESCSPKDSIPVTPDSATGQGDSQAALLALSHPSEGAAGSRAALGVTRVTQLSHTHCLTHVAAARPQEEEMGSETNPAPPGAAPAPHTEDRVVVARGYVAALAMVSTHLQRWSALSSRGVNFSRNSKAEFTSSVKS